MRSPNTIAVALLILGGQLVSASSAETTCGTCAAGYICKAGACVLDTAHLTGNPLPILTLTSDNPGGPIKTTGMSGTTDTATGEATTSTGEAKTTSSGGGHSGSSPSMTSQVVSMSAPASLSSSSSAAAAAATSSGVAGSLAMEWGSWVAWGVAWAVGLPLVA